MRPARPSIARLTLAVTLLGGCYSSVAFELPIDCAELLEADDAGVAQLPTLTVHIAGDSTVSTFPQTGSPYDRAGWGQFLPDVLSDRVQVDNRALGGRTALQFAIEGSFDRLLANVRPRDYVLIQFGTNDARGGSFEHLGQTYSRYADPDTDFKAQLKRYYIEPTRRLGATPVLVTPPPRRDAYCTGHNSVERWARAMRELGAAEHVPVADLNRRMVEYLGAICEIPVPENFFAIDPEGVPNELHFQQQGARIMAELIAEEIAAKNVSLSCYCRAQ